MDAVGPGPECPHDSANPGGVLVLQRRFEPGAPLGPVGNVAFSRSRKGVLAADLSHQIFDNFVHVSRRRRQLPSAGGGQTAQKVVDACRSQCRIDFSNLRVRVRHPPEDDSGSIAVGPLEHPEPDEPALRRRGPAGQPVRVGRLGDGRPEPGAQAGHGVRPVGAGTAVEPGRQRITAMKQVVEPVPDDSHPPGERPGVQRRIDHRLVEGDQPIAKHGLVGRVEETRVQPLGASGLDGRASGRTADRGRQGRREQRSQRQHQRRHVEPGTGRAGRFYRMPPPRARTGGTPGTLPGVPVVPGPTARTAGPAPVVCPAPKSFPPPPAAGRSSARR